MRGFFDHNKHLIVKPNGDMGIGDFIIGCGNDWNQQNRALDIMYALLRWKREGAPFMVKTEHEGPDIYLVEHNGMLTGIEMGTWDLGVYRDLIPMKTFARKFVEELRHYCRRGTSLPDNVDRKNGKRIVKAIEELLKIWAGKPIRSYRHRRGSARRTKRRKAQTRQNGTASSRKGG